MPCCAGSATSCEDEWRLCGPPPPEFKLVPLKGKNMKRTITIFAIVCATSLISSSSFAHRWCWACNQDNTYGWQLMTPEERKVHQAKLASFTGYNICQEYIDAHHRKMEERAKASGIDLPVMENNPCDALKDKGILM